MKRCEREVSFFWSGKLKKGKSWTDSPVAAEPHPPVAQDEETELLQVIWQGLPEQVQLKVVEEHLPLVALCRFRCVCKAWKTAKVTLAALRSPSYYLCNRSIRDNTLWLYNRPADKMYKLGQMEFDASSYSPLNSPCIDGLVAFASDAGDDIVVSDLFLSSWTSLPPTPPINPGDQSRRKAVFVGMGKEPGHGESLTEIPGECFVVAVMASKPDDDVDYYTDFILQVFSGGKWSTSCLIPFPEGYTCDEQDPYWDRSLAVLHGSLFYFLLRSIHRTDPSLWSVRLFSLDVLSEQPEACMVNESSCYQDIGLHQYFGSGRLGLGVCSGKVLLVYAFQSEEVQKCGVTYKVHAVEGEELKLVATSVQDGVPYRICFGGEEVLYKTHQCLGDENYNLHYNPYNLRYIPSASKWEKVNSRLDFGFLRPISGSPKTW